jgi:hypothetical protein
LRLTYNVFVMPAEAWSNTEVEAIVDDYLAMLASELAGTHYSKTEHRRALMSRLSNRSNPAIEFKHANISAVLLEAGFPYIVGYKPRSNYQALLRDITLVRLNSHPELLRAIEADADKPMAVPEIRDILNILVTPTVSTGKRANEPRSATGYHATNFIEREARNRSLGLAGEKLVLHYERERLIRAGHERLASKIEHTSIVQGDHVGFDILSFEINGAERLIEVKTTKHGIYTPFFVTRNEVAVSENNAQAYHVYRLFEFQKQPKLYTLAGAIERTCALTPATYSATPIG